MISIAIINLKGGVGKSVTACNLAAELAAMSCSVLVVDLDKQGNTSTLTRAYECSKLYKVQQMEYAKNGYARMATLEPSERNAVIEWLAQTELQPLFDGLDYINNGPHNYVDSAPAGHITWQTVQLDGTAAFGGNR